MAIPKVVGVMSCGFLLCLGLSHAAQADDAAVQDEMKLDQSDRRQGGQAGVRGERDKLKGGHRIEGEVLLVDGDHYFVKRQDGKEDRIEAKVNQNHALSIRSARGTDADHGNEAGRTTDSTLE